MSETTVVLREYRDETDLRSLRASLTPAGDLVIEGQDIGDGVEEYFGCREYEWTWTIRADDVRALRRAMGATGDVLSALQERFSDERASRLHEFLDACGVPYEAWSRTGD